MCCIWKFYRWPWSIRQPVLSGRCSHGANLTNSQLVAIYIQQRKGHILARADSQREVLQLNSNIFDSWADDQPKLKLLKLPDSKPTKRTITLTPDLDADLVAYAKVYEKAYGEKAEVNSMLAGFLASDAGFKKAKRELA